MVNPYDLEEASSAMAAALSMPRGEQQARMHSIAAHGCRIQCVPLGG
ncbi:MAG: hypothetical protein WDO18_18860 [Acidobacteriota bacterium]